MLSLSGAVLVIRSLTYRPGWSFDVEEDPFEGPYLLIEANVDDAFRPGASVHLRIRSPLPPFADADALVTWVLWRLGRIELHESLEFLRRGGVQVRDPHAQR